MCYPDLLLVIPTEPCLLILIIFSLVYAVVQPTPVLVFLIKQSTDKNGH